MHTQSTARFWLNINMYMQYVCTVCRYMDKLFFKMKHVKTYTYVHGEWGKMRERERERVKWNKKNNSSWVLCALRARTLVESDEMMLCKKKGQGESFDKLQCVFLS